MLSQAEAIQFIDVMKHTIEQYLAFPQNRSQNTSFTVVGEKTRNEFKINIDRKGINDTHCTYQGRVKQSNQILMRLDVGESLQHTNTFDGEREVIHGHHLHIYKENIGIDGMAYAVPFDIGNASLYELCYTFFEEFNIVEPPEISGQISLE